jgi:hypothetical protein
MGLSTGLPGRAAVVFEDARAGRQLFPDLCDNSFAYGLPSKTLPCRPRTGQSGLDPSLMISVSNSAKTETIPNIAFPVGVWCG